MEYPAEFSPQARAAVEAELILAWRRHVEQRPDEPEWRPRNAGCVRACIMSVFLTYSREVIKTGIKTGWAVDKIRAVAWEGLCSITIEVTAKSGSFEFWAGRKYLNPHVEREFGKTQEWRQFEDEILALATTGGRDQPGETASGGAAPSTGTADVEILGTGERARPGPKTDTETAQRVLEIVTRIADSEGWKGKLDDLSEALDDEKIPCPKTWGRRDPPIRNWMDAATTDRELAKKAIEYHLKIARG